MKREQLISLCFIALLVFVVIQIAMIFSPFLKAILWSAILAFGFFPVFKKLQETMPAKTNLAAILMALMVALIVLPPILLIVVNLTTQAIEMYQHASDYVRQGRLEDLIDRIRSLSLVKNIESNVLQWDPLKQRLSEWILVSSKSLANLSINWVGILTKNIIFIILNAFVCFFLLFIFFKDGEKILAFIYQILPLEEEEKKSIFGQINSTMAAVIRGQIVTSITQSVASGIIFAILGIPGSIFFAVATFFTSLIPVLGTWAIWLPLSGYLFISGETIKAFILFGLGIGFISVIDNVVKPFLIGERTKISYFLLFFGIMGGLKLYGLIGVFFAPVLLSLFFALIQIYKEKFKIGSLSDPA